jgi:hypothetical protein
MASVWIEVKVPPLGAKTGTPGVIVKVAAATGLCEKPDAMAIASMASVCETEIGPVYGVELVVGPDPSVV